MGKVTALEMDTITDGSGHVMTGLAVSVCLTPAAPAPLPIPYPTFGSVSEGITDPCMRTKIEGNKILTVGGCMSQCHGNEPGTLKEVVSFNTTGPCFPWLGAPIVFIELGMAGITGSMGQMNKAITVGGGASASGAGGGGGGGGSAGSGAGGPGGSGPGGGSNAGGGGGGSHSGAAPPNPPAAPTAEGQASGGHPVDVVTGALFTHPVTDLLLTGLLVFAVKRSYSSAAVGRDVGLGHGWSYDLDWSATRSGDRVEVAGPGARTFAVRFPGEGEVVQLPHGTRVLRSGEDLVIDGGDGLYRVLRRSAGRVAPHPLGSRYELFEVRDAFGNAVELTWERGELAGVVDSVGRRATLRREGPYRTWEVAVDDEEGQTHTRRAVTYEIDERRDLVRVLDAGGAESRFAYDDEHYLVREETPDGLVFHFRHEAVEGVKRCVETWGELGGGGDVLAALGRVPAPPGARGIFHTRFAYHPAQRTTVVNDGLGQAHTYVGNALGQVELYTDPRGYVRQYRYDPLGNLLSVVDGGGRTTRRAFDPAGRAVGYVARDGAAWRQGFDDEAGAVTLTRPDGRRDHFVHLRGELVEHTDPAGRTMTLERNEKGAIVKVTRAGGATFAYERDAHGNVRRVTRADGAVYEYTFDLFGRPTAIKSAGGVEYRLAYDSRDDLVLFEESGGKKTTFAIDAGRCLRERGEAGGATTFAYVGSALVETVRADGRRYRMGYDALLRLRWIENPAGERYDRDYDGSGNLARETSFAGVTTRREFDGSGHLVRVERSDGSWARFERDGEGRVLAAEYADGLSERFRYDDLGQLIHAESSGTTLAITRDVDGRAVREVQETGGFRFEVARTFDDDGNVTGRTYSTGWAVSMKRRSGDGALLSLRAVAAEPETLAFEHDARGEEIGRRRVEGRGSVSWERDVHGLPTRITVEGDGAILRERAYTWSPLGPVASVDDSRYGRRSYQLDPEGRPLAVEGLGASERFTFAPQGTAVPEGDPTWSIGADGRPTAAGGDRLSWDARGRLSRRAGAGAATTWEYAYDERDRLVRADRGDGAQIRHVYDALGRRVATVYDDGQSTWFGWDGDTVVEEQGTAGARTLRVFADDGFTPLLEGRDGKDWRMVVTDAAGTPWLHLHGDLSLSELELTAWGGVARSSGDPGAMRFAGQRADAVTGLHYNRNRFYAPDLHVFLTPDPLGVTASLQDVGFVRNVTLYIDALGLTIIVNADPADATINASTARLQAAYPGATVLRYDQLTPGSLSGENHVIVNSHGYPGGIVWGNGTTDGQQLGTTLSNAGFRGGFGRTVDITACNSATPQQGGGPSTAQALSNSTGTTVHGAMSNNPQVTYAGTTAPGPGGYQWGPGMLGTNGTQTPYVHDGTWDAVTPNTAGGWGRRVWRGLF